MGQTQRFGGFGLCRALVDSPCDGVAGVAITPVCLGFLTACRLAVGISAGALSASHSRIGPEPPATDGARSLPGLGHRDDLSSSSPSDRGEAGGQFRISGSFLVSRGGSFLESAEGTRVCAKQGVPCMTSLSMVTTPASALFCSAVIADSMIGDLPAWGKSRGIDIRQLPSRGEKTQRSVSTPDQLPLPVAEGS